MLQSRFIDLENYKTEDLIFKGIQGAILNMSVTGSPTITVKGEHKATGAYDLAVINMSNMDKTASITGEGMYMIPILGCDKVELEVSGTGTIYAKEI